MSKRLLDSADDKLDMAYYQKLAENKPMKGGALSRIIEGKEYACKKKLDFDFEEEEWHDDLSEFPIDGIFTPDPFDLAEMHSRWNFWDHVWNFNK